VEQGRPNEAISACTAILEDDPGNVDACLLLGNIRRLQGDADQALSAFLRAAACAPDSAECLCMLGSMQFETGQVEQAIASFERAVECKDPGVDAWLMLASLYERTGQPERTADCYHGAISAEPGDPRAVGQLGALLVRQEQYAPAEQVLRQGIAKTSDDTSLWDLLAVSIAAQGRLYDARVALDEALLALPDEPILIIRRADVLEQRGDRLEAFETLRPLLEAQQVPLEAALVFARFCNLLEMPDEGRILVEKAAAATDMTQNQRAAVRVALQWIEAQSV